MDYDLLYENLSATSRYEGTEKDFVIHSVMELVEILSETSKNDDMPILICFDLINAAIATAVAFEGNFGAVTLADHMKTMGIQLENQVKRVRNDLPPSANDDILVL